MCGMLTEGCWACIGLSLRRTKRLIESPLLVVYVSARIPPSYKDKLFWSGSLVKRAQPSMQCNKSHCDESLYGGYQNVTKLKNLLPMSFGMSKL